MILQISLNHFESPTVPVLLVPQVGGTGGLLRDRPHLVERQPVHQAAGESRSEGER